MDVPFYTPAEMLQLKRAQEIRDANRAAEERKSNLLAGEEACRRLAEAARFAVRAVPHYEAPIDLSSSEVLDARALQGLETWTSERERRASVAKEQLTTLLAELESFESEAARRRNEAACCRQRAAELRRELSVFERPFAPSRAARGAEAEKMDRQAFAKDTNAAAFEREAFPLRTRCADLTVQLTMLTTAAGAGREAIEAVHRAWDAGTHLRSLKLSAHIPTPAEVALARRLAADARETDRKARREAQRAKAAAYDDRVREDAEAVRRSLRRDHPCPLCGQDLGQNPHADHIHPVSQGGLSIYTNMVFVCETCNLSKGAATVLEFARRTNRDVQAIADRLRALGKRV